MEERIKELEARVKELEDFQLEVLKTFSLIGNNIESLSRTDRMILDALKKTYGF